MAGLAEFALAGAPVAGGALLALAAGNIKGPDIRGSIKADMELLAALPPEQVERRAALQRSIDMRIDDIVSAVEKNREIRQLAASYSGNWRDVVVFICAVLFTLVWWHVSHDRSNWLIVFIVLITMSAIVGVYAARGIFRALASFRHGRAGN